MRKIVAILFVFLCCQVEAQVLDRFFEKLERETLEARFTITVEDKVTQPLNYAGQIKMRGERFVATAFDIEAAYDGETLSIYSEDTNELTLSRPTAEELAEANPLLYAKALQASCNVEEIEDATQYVVILTPTQFGAEVLRFTLTLRKQDLLPLRATMKETGNRVTRLELREQKYTQDMPRFVLEKEGAYVNDVR